MTDTDRNAKDSSGAYVTPSEVEAEEGLVSVDGPDGVAVTLTPDAAIETSERLLQAGSVAKGQTRAEKTPPDSGGKTAGTFADTCSPN